MAASLITTPGAKLPERFHAAWAAAAETPFLAWWQATLERSLEDPATEGVLPRTATQRAIGREEAFLAEQVLPQLSPELARALLAHLEQAEPVDAAVAACIVGLTASHRPFLIAQEILKPLNDRLERRFLHEALEALSPERFFGEHLSGAGLANLRRAWPAGFARRPELLGPKAWLLLVASMDESGLDRSEVAALTAWRSLLTEARSFDYGSGLGALVTVFSEQFEAHGGDIHGHEPCGELKQGLAWLRATRDLGSAPRVDRGRIIDLDPHPSGSGPPEGGSFSVVTCNGVMEHVLDPAGFDAVLHELKRLLAPGGVLLLNAHPTLLGFDGHHALNPWWGVLLHRFPSLQRHPFFSQHWRRGFTHRVSRRRLVAPLADRMTAPRQLWPQEASVRERFGPLTPVGLPLLRFLGRRGLALGHAVVLSRRLED